MRQEPGLFVGEVCLLVVKNIRRKDFILKIRGGEVELQGKFTARALGGQVAGGFGVVGLLTALSLGLGSSQRNRSCTRLGYFTHNRKKICLVSSKALCWEGKLRKRRRTELDFRRPPLQIKIRTYKRMNNRQDSGWLQIRQGTLLRRW